MIFTTMASSTYAGDTSGGKRRAEAPR